MDNKDCAPYMCFEQNTCDVHGCSNKRMHNFHYIRCKRKFTVIRDGKQYCSIHDPEYIKVKNAKRDKAYSDKRERESNLQDIKDKKNEIINYLKTPLAYSEASIPLQAMLTELKAMEDES